MYITVRVLYCVCIVKSRDGFRRNRIRRYEYNVTRSSQNVDFCMTIKETTNEKMGKKDVRNVCAQSMESIVIKPKPQEGQFFVHFRIVGLGQQNQFKSPEALLSKTACLLPFVVRFYAFGRFLDGGICEVSIFGKMGFF